MRMFRDFIGENTYPVIEFNRRFLYENGERTERKASFYTILSDYEKISIVVLDEGTAVTEAEVKRAADNGTPIQMVFYGLELTIKPKSQWEISVSGRADKAELVSEK